MFEESYWMMLTRAAKAAGMQIKIDDIDSSRVRASVDGEHWPIWDPLDDDGDSFRLAAALNLCLAIGKNGIIISRENDFHRIEYNYCADNKLEIIRYVILKIADSIGFATP